MIEQLQTQVTVLAIALIVAAIIALIVAPFAIRARRDAQAARQALYERANSEMFAELRQRRQEVINLTAMLNRSINAHADEQELTRRYHDELYAAQAQMREILETTSQVRARNQELLETIQDMQNKNGGGE